MSTPHISSSNWRSVHGFLGDPSWSVPVLTVRSNEISRPGYDDRTLSHEYIEDKTTLSLKVKLLSKLLRSASHAVIYSGAGLSTSSGIDDYATHSKESLALSDRERPKVRNPLDARPTLSHRVLSQLCGKGVIKRWIQQNHDGLPQKSGLPQHAINEIHGAWYDVSNPVVMMKGSLRTDLFNDLLDWEQKADLVLTVGTSLSGMNADRIVKTCAEKSMKTNGNNKTIGSVIISLQKTQHDGLACLRIFERIDRVMEMLGEEMKDEVDMEKVRDDMKCDRIYKSDVPKEYRVIDRKYGESKNTSDTSVVDEDNNHVYLIPYGSDGLPLPPSAPRRVLDLREGSRVRITKGEFEGDEGEVVGTTKEGHIKILCKHEINSQMKNRNGASNETPKKSFMAPMTRILGLWWIEGGVKGQLRYFPVTNVNESENGHSTVTVSTQRK